jgi:serine/threonine protein kinase
LAGHPRYHLLQLLGTGGMGSVYRAQHRLMERSVALKVINPNLGKKPAMVERFQREVKAAARLTHAHIVTAHDAEQAGDTHFLVMEFVDGVSLAQRVQQGGRLPVAEACTYVRQAALGLQHAFERGMVHRDIKPHNLMLTGEGQVKILDFGLARFVRETASSGSDAAGTALPPATQATEQLTEVGSLMGTADFIAPEQADDPRQADIRADIYSLGCTLYYLLAGHSPFPEGTSLEKLAAHRERVATPIGKLRDDLPAGLPQVIERMMAKGPGERYQTPADVAEALTRFAKKASPPRRRIRRVVATAACLAAAVIAGAVIYVQTDKGEFVIETENANVALMISEKGGVRIHDRGSNREFHLNVGKNRVPSGEYEIDVTELPAGVEFTTTKPLVLKRGGKVSAVATFKPTDRLSRLNKQMLKSVSDLFQQDETFGSQTHLPRVMKAPSDTSVNSLWNIRIFADDESIRSA